MRVVASKPIMDVTPLEARAAHLGIGDTLDFRLRRLDEHQMADLFEEAESFIFDYKQIDASAAYFLAAPFRKWIIASRAGVFEEDLRLGIDSQLVEPSSESDLREAILAASASPLGKTPEKANRSWSLIGLTTGILSIPFGLRARRSAGRICHAT